MKASKPEWLDPANAKKIVAHDRPKRAWLDSENLKKIAAQARRDESERIAGNKIFQSYAQYPRQHFSPCGGELLGIKGKIKIRHI